MRTKGCAYIQVNMVQKGAPIYRLICVQKGAPIYRLKWYKRVRLYTG